MLATGCEVLAAAVLCSRAATAFAAAAAAGRRGACSLFMPAVAVALGAALVKPAAKAAREALKLGRLRRREEEEEAKSNSFASSPSSAAAAAAAAALVVEAEAAVSSSISEAVNSMMTPMGLAVVAALVLG